MGKIYGYIRVSTEKQTVENQRFEIKRLCREQSLEVDGWIEETISGNKSYGKRELGLLLRRLRRGDLIICSELSRLGRSLFMIMEILSLCMSKECQVWTVKEGYRTRDALAMPKAQGVSVGRPKGSFNVHHKLDGSEDLIRSMLRMDCTCDEIARACGVCRKTVYRWKSRISD